MFGVMQHLSVELCSDALDAAAKGYHGHYKYRGVTPVNVAKVVIVRDGTEGHNSTADFLLEDAEGNKYMFVVTGNLLKSLPV